MAFRDIVDNCGDGSRASNPVLRMIDAFTGEKEAFHQKWAAQNLTPHIRNHAAPMDPRMMAAAHQMPPEDFRRFEEAEMERELGMLDMEYNMDPRMGRGRMMPPGRMGPPPSAFMPPGNTLQFKRPPGISGEFFDRMGIQDRASIDAEQKLWVDGYKVAMENDNEGALFEAFERAYDRVPSADPRIAPHHPLRHGPMQNGGKWHEEFTEEEDYSKFESVYQGGMKGEEWTKEFEEEEQLGKLTEFAERIPSAKAHALQQTASEIASIQDPKFRQSELFKMMTAISNGEITFQGDKVVPVPADQQEEIRRGPKLDASSSSTGEKWASEFEEESRPGGIWQRDYEDWNAKLEEEYRKTYGDDFVKEFQNFDAKFASSWAEGFKESENEDTEDYDTPLGEGESENEDTEDYDTPLGEGDFNYRETAPLDPQANVEYEMSKENQFRDDPSAFEKGKRLFDAGRLTEAIEAFEAAIQQEPNNSFAWQMLGASQAENDRDDLASMALLKAVQVNPDNGDALMTLSVSYTNDYRKLRALECLIQWISVNKNYQQLPHNITFTDDFDENHAMVVDLFIQAARLRPNDPDPDVQVALGLLYNLTFDYQKAIDCFKAAVLKRPDDYLIWNKLGATQANAKCNTEAIDAYIRALEIKPSYTRACGNLGISFMALREYGEAAKAYLSALALNPNAVHQWDNLRSVFHQMRRPDLLQKIENRDVALFSDEFNF